MGDDVGWFNIGAYHRGIMAGKTPNLDQLASQGMMFTDYYAEASCTAGRANFITGEIPLRTGLTTVGQAGADVGMPDRPSRWRPFSRRRATRPASSARITLAT
jgi:arylsulfatase